MSIVPTMGHLILSEPIGISIQNYIVRYHRNRIQYNIYEGFSGE